MENRCCRRQRSLCLCLWGSQSVTLSVGESVSVCVRVCVCAFLFVCATVRDFYFNFFVDYYNCVCNSFPSFVFRSLCSFKFIFVHIHIYIVFIYFIFMYTFFSIFKILFLPAFLVLTRSDKSLDDDSFVVQVICNWWHSIFSMGGIPCLPT